APLPCSLLLSSLRPPAPTQIYTLSLHDALPISLHSDRSMRVLLLVNPRSFESHVATAIPRNITSRTRTERAAAPTRWRLRATCPRHVHHGQRPAPRPPAVPRREARRTATVPACARAA